MFQMVIAAVTEEVSIKVVGAAGILGLIEH